MRQVRITKLSSSICWWINCVGQICPVLEVYEPTGFIKIRVIMSEVGFDDDLFEVEGWIRPECVEEVK